MSKLTTQDKLDIIALTESGMTQCNIAKMYNVSANTISTVICRAKHGSDLNGTSANRRLSEQEVVNLINDLRNREETGVTIVQLAVKYNVCEHTISRYIEKYGLHAKAEHVSRLSDEQKQKIYEQYNSGVSVNELSEEFGVSSNTIYKTISDLRKSNEKIADTIKIITEQFDSEMNSVTDSTFISNIDQSLLSESTAKLVDELENRKKELFKIYKEYSLELINYLESANTVSEIVKAEMEEKYRYLQSKFEREAV